MDGSQGSQDKQSAKVESKGLYISSLPTAFKIDVLQGGILCQCGCVCRLMRMATKGRNRLRRFSRN